MRSGAIPEPRGQTPLEDRRRPPSSNQTHEEVHMYRGYIAEIGTLVGAEAQRIAVRAPKVCESLAPGGSIAVAGVCLSAVAVEDDVFRVDVSTETGHRSM